MPRRNLDLLDLLSTVRPLVLDSHVRKLDALVHDRQLVVVRPVTDFLRRAGGPTGDVGAMAVPFLHELLVRPFEC
jgi:hypothetical protein